MCRHAETCFMQSLKLSRSQDDLTWELRRRQGRIDEALGVLAPAYHRFTEGFDTLDLEAATHLLDELNRCSYALTIRSCRS
jgi:hypothetical protein